MKKREKKLRETEMQILRYVMEWLQYHGWTVLRIPPGIYGPKGLPDLYAARRGYSCWIEIKRTGGQLSMPQRRMHMKLEAAGIDVFVITGMDGPKGALSMLEEIDKHGGA